MPFPHKRIDTPGSKQVSFIRSLKSGGPGFRSGTLFNDKEK